MSRHTPEHLPVVDSVLGEPGEPTDESPTVISKTQPRLQPTAPSGELRGRRLAHFELLEQVGAGGMAAVLRAHDTQLERDVALKILPPDLAVDQENVHRFHQEARSAAKLDHENIARVFFCGEDQGLHFIAFEFVEGENLRTVLERRGRLPVGEALSCVTQVAAGLAHAAERGVVHRDIKPSNILITADGRAKLVDMGLARSLERKDDKGLTHSGVTLGTFDYISPEQALEPREADVRSDIYSLGCTLYHLLTGRPPVPEGTAARKLHHHQHVPPIDPRELAPEIPDGVAVLLDRMMAKRPEQRQQTAGQLLSELVALERALALGEADAAGPGVPTPRSWGVPVLLACLAVVAVVVLVVFLSPAGSGPLPGGVPAPVRPNDSLIRGSDVVQTTQPDNATDPRTTVPVVANSKPVVYESDEPTAEELAAWLQQHADAPKVVVRLARDLELVVGSEAGRLLARAREIDIGPKVVAGKPVPRPTLRLTYNGVARPHDLWAALALEGKTVTVHGLRFLIDGGGGVVPLAALVLRGEKNRVVDCEFYQTQLDERSHSASVVVEASESASFPPGLTVEKCCFLGFRGLEGKERLTDVEAGGQDALAVRGGADVAVRQCAFGPHEALCRVEGKAKVGLSHCTFLAGARSAVFHVVDRGATLTVEDSLFSVPRAFAPGRGFGIPPHLPSAVGTKTVEAVVLRQEPGAASYSGKGNRYCNLSAFEAPPGGASEREFRPPPDTQDKDSSLWLRCNPSLLAQPLRRLAALTLASPVDGTRPVEDALLKAFEPDTRALDLRVGGDQTNRLVGVETFSAGSYLSQLSKTEAAQRQTLIVDPTRSENKNNGYYQQLETALVNARPGDSILLRADLVSTPSLEVKVDGNLTITPDEDYQPVLVLTQDAMKATAIDTALFRLTSAGLLTLERLEFQIKPTIDGFHSLAVVALIGDGSCTFNSCLITLEAGTVSQSAQLAAVTLTELKEVMRKPSGSFPTLTFQRCTVRGQGDLVLGQVARPLTFFARRSVLALSGSLLTLEVGLTATTEARLEVTASLENVTACLGGSVLNLKCIAKPGQVLPVVCTPSQCLFLPLNSEGVFAHVEGPDLDAESLSKQLPPWKGAVNAYGVFGTFVETKQGDAVPMPLLKGEASWQTFLGEKPETSLGKYHVPLTNGALLEEGLAALKLRPMAMRVGDFGIGDADRQALVELFPSLLPPRSSDAP